MTHRHTTAVLGLLLIVLGVVVGHWALLVAWLGCDFIMLSVAYRRGAHGVFGKRSDGTLQIWRSLIFAPLLAFTWSVWNLLRFASVKAAYANVTNQLVVGRRLLASELDQKFDNFVDLTAEFVEPESIRSSSTYFSFPILDGAAPLPESLSAAVANLRPGRTFIHCAQGHGRTGLFALAVLLSSGAAQTVEEGLQLLQSVRPGIHLSRAQYICIQEYDRLRKKTAAASH